MERFLRQIMGAAAVTIGLIGQNAEAQQGPLNVMTFNCHVDTGPKLTACHTKEPSDFDPRKIESLRDVVEGTPSCKLAGITPGTEVDWPIHFLDSPALLQPPPPLASGKLRHMIENPNVLEGPSAELMAKLYPKGAQATGKSGRAVIDCEVNVDGSAGQCAVVEESPPGAGFGEAALEASSHFRFRPKAVDCVPTGGAHIRLPITFVLQAGR